MSSTAPLFGDRFVDLLIQRSTAGLSESEQQEFKNLSLSPKHESEVERYDLTVAALDLAFGSPNGESMPRDIQDRLLLAAGNFFRNGSAGASTATSADAKVELSQRRAANRFSWREAVALAVTAACVMLMLSGYNPFATQPGLEKELENVQRISQQRKESLDNQQIKLQGLTDQLASLKKSQEDDTVVKTLTPTELMQQFMESKPADLVQVNWQPVQAKNAGGQVVWSDSRQEGYMEISGLRVNDPTVEQYQLWIFDTDKDQKLPPDGGVFDITGGKVVIPIKAHIPIDKAVQFAITIEDPGGVMQSDRKQLPLLATVD